MNAHAKQGFVNLKWKDILIHFLNWKESQRENAGLYLALEAQKTV